MSGRYRTIVADPPWAYEDGCVALGPGHGDLSPRQPLPYSGMSIEDIFAIPVADWAEPDCRLFLWTTNRYLDDAFDVLRAWRFKYRQTLVWHKRDVNLMGSVAPNAAEFVLVATRGAPARLGTMPSNVVSTTRKGSHSTKSEAWMDYFETISPAPRLEMFSRRARLGWDTHGNESLHGIEATA